MEWINPEHEQRDPEQIVADTEVCQRLDAYGNDTSIYAIDLLPELNQKEVYVLTSDGRVYPGGSVKCMQTQQKNKITKDTVRVVVDKQNNVFQFIAVLDDTMIDARGNYARTQLKSIRKGKRLEG